MKTYVKEYKDLSKDELYRILRLRLSVFVLEQDRMYQDLDEKDEGAIHVFIKDDDDTDIIAYARVLDQNINSEHVTITRVISNKRGLGLGKKIIKESLKAAKSYFHPQKIYLEAQKHAQGFYEKLGFKKISGDYDNGGITHVEMTTTSENVKRLIED